VPPAFTSVLEGQAYKTNINPNPNHTNAKTNPKLKPNHTDPTNPTLLCLILFLFERLAKNFYLWLVHNSVMSYCLQLSVTRSHA